MVCYIVRLDVVGTVGCWLFPHGLIKIVNNLSLFLQNSFKSIKYGENSIQINDDMMVLAPKKTMESFTSSWPENALQSHIQHQWTLL